MKDFLSETQYADFSAQNIQAKTTELFDGISDDIQKVRIAYEFVRDKVLHSFDIGTQIITVKASDVLKHGTGICHAQANLLAAFLRSQDIPAGFCFQRITLADDDCKGYCVHCYNAVWLNTQWVKLDTSATNAQFSLDKPMLAFPCRSQYQEYFWPGIYAFPHKETMIALEQAGRLQEAIQNLPDHVDLPPDAWE